MDCPISRIRVAIYMVVGPSAPPIIPIDEASNKPKSKKEEVMTPIQSHRVATMGRLAEMGLVEWVIGKESQSTYKINEKAREQVDVILNTK